MVGSPIVPSFVTEGDGIRHVCNRRHNRTRFQRNRLPIRLPRPRPVPSLLRVSSPPLRHTSGKCRLQPPPRLHGLSRTRLWSVPSDGARNPSSGSRPLRLRSHRRLRHPSSPPSSLSAHAKSTGLELEADRAGRLHHRTFWISSRWSGFHRYVSTPRPPAAWRKASPTFVRSSNHSACAGVGFRWAPALSSAKTRRGGRTITRSGKPAGLWRESWV